MKALILIFMSLVAVSLNLNRNESNLIKLPKPQIKGTKSFFETLQSRRSHRRFSSKALSQSQISQILWSTAGLKLDAITEATRTIPSAGATYPLELYLLVGERGVVDLPSGIYHYLLQEHALKQMISGDLRRDLAAACWRQDFIAQAPISVIVAAKYSRTTLRYGQRGIRYVHMEVGHACQNLYLVAESLSLGTVEIGAFEDSAVKRLLKINFEPLAIMPVGYVSR